MTLLDERRPAEPATHEPRTAEEMHAAHKARRARMDARARSHQAENRLPGFVRDRRGEAMEPGFVLEAVAATFPGAEAAAGFKPAAAYWLLGLSGVSALQVAACLGFSSDAAAIDAMRAHARMTGLPPIDMRDGRA